MARVFNEKVTAEMHRLVTPEEVFIMRRNTQIHFDDSPQVIGTYIGTNPGSFSFSNPEWKLFEQGDSSCKDVLIASGYPDLTMQNVIRVVRGAYQRAGKGEPRGVVRVLNISNVRQPKGVKAEEYRRSVKDIMKNIDDASMQLLEEPATHGREDFMKNAEESPFVLLGFVRNVFPNQVDRLLGWANEIGNKSIVVRDQKGYVVHPRRLQTEQQYRFEAIEVLSRLLSH